MDFWEEVRDFYNHGLFCDLRLVTSDSPEGLRCHQLVMASVSTLLHDILRTHYRHNDENSDLIVNLPDIGKDDLEPILGTVYAKLGAKNCNQDYMCINPDITELLGLCEPIDLKDGHVILDSVKNELPESRVKVEEYNFEGDFQDYYPLSDWANEEEEEDEKPLKRRFQASGTARKRSRAEPTKRRGPRPKKKKLENSRAKELLNLSEEAKALLTPEAQEKLDEAVNETLEEDPEDAEMDKFWGDDAWKRNDDEKLVIKVPKRQKRNPNGKPQKRYKQKKAPKPELCTICGKSFNWTRSLEYHMQYVHGTKEKDMPCHLCDKKFNRKQSLVNHIKGVHVDAKEFQCDQCEKQFSLRNNLLKHIREIHLNEKPFKCEHEGCDKSYSDRQSVIDHTNFDHLGLKKFQCDWCGSQFPRKAAVVRHKKRACKFRDTMKADNPLPNHPHPHPPLPPQQQHTEIPQLS